MLRKAVRLNLMLSLLPVVLLVGCSQPNHSPKQDDSQVATKPSQALVTRVPTTITSAVTPISPTSQATIQVSTQPTTQPTSQATVTQVVVTNTLATVTNLVTPLPVTVLPSPSVTVPIASPTVSVTTTAHVTAPVTATVTSLPTGAVIPSTTPSNTPVLTPTPVTTETVVVVTEDVQPTSFPSTTLDEVVPTPIANQHLLDVYGIQLDAFGRIASGYKMIYSDMRDTPVACVAENDQLVDACQPIQVAQVLATPQPRLSLVNDQPGYISYDEREMAYSRLPNGWRVQNRFELGNALQSVEQTDVSITDSAIFTLEGIEIFGGVFCGLISCPEQSLANGTLFSEQARMAIYRTQSALPRSNPTLKLKVLIECTDSPCDKRRVDQYPVDEHPLVCQGEACKINLSTGEVLAEDSTSLGFVSVMPFSAGNLVGYEFAANEFFEAHYLVRVRGTGKQTNTATGEIKHLLLANWFEFSRVSASKNGWAIMFNQAAKEEMVDVLAQ